MHRLHITTTALSMIALAVTSSSASAAITFLHHFDDTASFDINTGNGDYSGGDTTATTAGSPATTTGFFTSQPDNYAYYSTGDFQSVAFTAPGGAVQLASPNSGGITVGAWVKINATSSPVVHLYHIGNTDSEDDYLRVDIGASNTWIPRIAFRDGSSTVFAASNGLAAQNGSWIYLASTVDLGNALVSLYGYDSTGSLLFSTSTAAPASPNWNVDNSLLGDTSVIRIGGRNAVAGTAVSIDEFSIDSVVLSQPEIAARVASMVEGNPLVVPEPAAIALLVPAAFALASRRRRA